MPILIDKDSYPPIHLFANKQPLRVSALCNDLFGHLMTLPVLELVRQVNDLQPDNPVLLDRMLDKDLLKRSAGGSHHRTPEGTDVVLLDPTRATEQIVAHELMHALLGRQGWPRVYPLLPMVYDPDAVYVADLVRNIVDHYVFWPTLREMQVDLGSYQQWMLDSLLSWPDTEVESRALVANAFKILEVTTWGRSYRTKILRHMSQSQSKALRLSLRLEPKLRIAQPRLKLYSRAAILALLQELEKWLSEEVGTAVLATDRFWITGVFSTEELELPAHSILSFASFARTAGNVPFWFVTFSSRVDGTIVGGQYWKQGMTIEEPAEAKETLMLWRTAKLHQLLVALSIPYGVCERCKLA